MQTDPEDHEDPPRRARRRTWVLAVLAAFVAGLLLGETGGGDPPRSPPPAAVADVRQDERSAARLVAERRYADGVRAGVAEGRATVRRGSAGYKRIWRRGYREAERVLRARTAARPATGGSYASGHRDGYDEGYDEGYGHADAGRPYDNSDNDTPGSVGDDDAGAVDGTGSTTDGSSDAGADCHPSYEGACVPADAGDVNCPDVPGTDVRVVGEDVYGLDREGDGLACES